MIDKPRKNEFFYDLYVYIWSVFYFYFIKVNHPVSVQKEATGNSDMDSQII